MTRHFWVLALLLVGRLAHAQTCNPACASQPPQCCGVAPPPPILAEQCTGATSDVVHFVLPGTGTGWVDLRTPALFSVAGLSGTTTLGDVMPVTFQFTIGTSSASARFQVLEGTTRNIIGQCVTTGGNRYTGLPPLISAQGRALQVTGRNPLWCRYTPTATGTTTDILCFAVKGQVGAPFVAQELCDPDRVEYACGVVVP